MIAGVCIISLYGIIKPITLGSAISNETKDDFGSVYLTIIKADDDTILIIFKNNYQNRFICNYLYFTPPSICDDCGILKQILVRSSSTSLGGLSCTVHSFAVLAKAA